jgi:tol-pal system protein YbgF
MTCSPKGLRCAAVFVAVALLATASGATGQERSGGVFDNLFSRGGQDERSRPEAQALPPGRQMAQADDGDLGTRVNRIENALRQLTGTLEQLQHQNQMLQMQLKRMQDDTDYRFQQQGGRAAPSAPAAPAATPAPGAAPPAAAGQRSDVFDPARNPTAPGAPRTLGNSSAAAPPPIMANEPPLGAPGGRAAGAPLDLSTLAGNAPAVAGSVPDNAPALPPQAASAQQAPQPPLRSPTGTQVATLPPSATPKDAYDLAYGYVLHKDYALAEQAFRDFLNKYPNERLLPEAQYWLGESQFQQQRYRDAAESFLAVSTKYERSSKAPEALLRLGESLGALHQKEAACATFAEVGRKYPRASASVKQGVAREQKRAHC